MPHIGHFTNTNTNETIHSPSRYKDGGELEEIECIFGTGDGIAFSRGNIRKYIRRYKQKNGIEDLKKAKQYLDFMIAFETGGMEGLKSLLNTLAVSSSNTVGQLDYMGISTIAKQVSRDSSGRRNVPDDVFVGAIE